MGCFLACFGTKEKKRQKPAIKSLPRSRSHGSYGYLPQTDSPKQLTTEWRIDSIPVSRENSEEPNLSSRKKVTFDLNVKSYSKVSVDDDLNSLLEKDQKKQSDGEEAIEREVLSITSSGDSSTASTTCSSYPPSHRYQNCRCSDDEDEDDFEDEEEEDDYDGEEDDDDEGSFESEDSFESYYSSVDAERKIPASQQGKQEINNRPICDSLEDHKSMLPLTQNARDRSQYVHSVLNPVENLSQWKALKHKDSQRMPLKQHRKENIISEQEMQIPLSSEPTFKLPKLQTPINSVPSFKLPKEAQKEDISVDASLSNWLIPSEASPMSKSGETQLDLAETRKYQSLPARTISPITQDDRPILGALTVEEIKRALPRRSPCRSPSPDEIPILGTVGTYWNHSNQAMDSSPNRICLEKRMRQGTVF